MSMCRAGFHGYNRSLKAGTQKKRVEMSSDEVAIEWMTFQALPNRCDVFQPGKRRTQFAM